jgi:hypothetical protein
VLQRSIENASAGRGKHKQKARPAPRKKAA